MQENNKTKTDKTTMLLAAFGLAAGAMCVVFHEQAIDGAKEMYNNATSAIHQASKPETILRLTQR